MHLNFVLFHFTLNLLEESSELESCFKQIFKSVSALLRVQVAH